MAEPLLFEKSVPGRRGVTFPPVSSESEVEALLPQSYRRTLPLPLPEVSENEIIRHYTRLSTANYGVDTGFYPLGSCTMKYNPKLHEEVARYPGFSSLHPLQPVESVQGALRLLYELQQFLAEISGMDQVVLQPAAGAQGELVGMLMVRAYHRDRARRLRKGERQKALRRTQVIIPDSAHGTNPASAALAGLTVQTVRTNKAGRVDIDDLRKVADDQTAAMMLTNPNTLGLFEKEIETIRDIVHQAGGLLYLDGANLNALLGLVRPGDMGFDLVHFNLHKTFSTPHGGGGPGAGPVGAKGALIPYLPAPWVERVDNLYRFERGRRKSVGRVHAFHGNFGILVRAYAYIRRLGAEGLSAVSRNAILNANYLKKQLQADYDIPYNNSSCMHEFVLSAGRFKAQGVRAWDIAKRLIDDGFYPPTVNFPHIVEEALMIETPESEAKETLEAFARAMRAIRAEIEKEPEKVIRAPHSASIRRVDEVAAAKRLDVRYIW